MTWLFLPAIPGSRNRLDVILATAAYASFLRSKTASHLSAQKLGDEPACNRKPDECAQVTTKHDVRHISDQIRRQKH